jgi:hypothetical protein
LFAGRLDFAFLSFGQTVGSDTMTFLTGGNAMKTHGINRLIRGGLKKHFLNVLSVALMIGLTVMPAKAYDFSGVVGHVTNVTPVGMPGYVEFTTDTMPSNCNGALFYYPPSNVDEATQQSNTKAIMAVVLSAQLSGRQVAIYGIFPTSTFQYCTVQWIYTVNS